MNKIRLPFPDPFGILNALTKDAPIELFDPLVAAREIQEAVGAGAGPEAPAVPEAAAPEEKSYVDEKIEKYKYHLEQALLNAPCQGCRAITKSALVAVGIFEEMSRSGKGRAEFSDKEIERIKMGVEDKYKDYA